MSDMLGDILFQPTSSAPAEAATSSKATAAPAVEETKPDYKTYEDFDYTQLLTYAGIDTYATSKIVAKMFPALIEKPEYRVPTGPGIIKSTRAPALLDIYQECTGEIFDFICDLELAGINYDVKENRRLNISMKQEVLELEDRIWSAIGKRVNLDSGPEVAKLLYEEKGLVAPHKTKSGEDATDGAALLLLCGLDPGNPGEYLSPDPAMQYLADIVKRKNIASVHRSFVESYIDDYLQPDGRIHALYNQFGTSSYRLSASEPSLQNVPRAFGVKRCFNTKPGNVFICADFSSAEFKILAALCGDENLIAAILAGRDLHTYTASTMYNIPYDDLIAGVKNREHPNHKLFKLYRQNSKAAGFGVVFGSSAAGLAITLNITKEAAQELLDLYFIRFPKLKTYVDTTHAEAKLNGFVITKFGHRRNYYGAQDVFKYTAAYNAALRGSQNYKVQSSTSVIGAVTFSKINRAVKLMGGMCTATVHDSVELEVPLSRAAEAVEMVYHYMDDWPQTQYPWLKLSIGSELEIGWNWGDMTELHRGATQEDVLKALTP